MTPEEWWRANHSPAHEKYVAAALIDRFNLRPWEIARLTPWQKSELYFHPRDKDGNLKVPEIKTEAEEVEPTLESSLADLNRLAAAVASSGKPFGPEKLEAARQKIKAKFGGA